MGLLLRQPLLLGLSFFVEITQPLRLSLLWRWCRRWRRRQCWRRRWWSCSVLCLLLLRLLRLLRLLLLRELRELLQVLLLLLLLLLLVLLLFRVRQPLLLGLSLSVQVTQPLCLPLLGKRRLRVGTTIFPCAEGAARR